jgi:acyl-coenzyme A thioesterase 1/2/4
MTVDSKEVLDFLGSIPLLQQLPGASVQKIADVVKLRHFEPGEMLVHEGSPGEGLYFLYKGEAEVSASISGTMMQHTMPILKPGDYFGYACSGPVKTLHKADINAITEVLLSFPVKHKNINLGALTECLDLGFNVSVSWQMFWKVMESPNCLPLSIVFVCS